MQILEYGDPTIWEAVGAGSLVFWTRKYISSTLEVTEFPTDGSLADIENDNSVSLTHVLTLGELKIGVEDS